jgi:anti-sigma B factor antagonist
MPQQGLNVSVENGVTVVTFGNTTVLDIATSEAMAKELLALVNSPPPPRVLIDFTAVRFLASRMLGVLVEMTRKAETGHGKVVACGLHPDLCKVLQVMRLEQLLSLVDSKQDAMKALAAEDAP